MKKIIGLDLGTNSAGIAVRDTDASESLLEQFAFFGVDVFKSGVGNGKTGEFSYAAERTKYRTTRNRYKSRKYRRFSTLKELIDNGLCPLSEEGFIRWKCYDKKKGLKREYPSQETRFEQWIRLDFDGDGIPEYPSPFHLRAELVSRKLDLSNEIERFKLGRALYHFALHRGFKSSKGETLKEQDENDSQDTDTEMDISALKKSEEKTSGKLVEYMRHYDLPTVGCACAKLLDEGIRVRESEYMPVRSQLKDEVQKMLLFQGFTSEDNLWEAMLSEKKGVGTIFYKRPYRSQKGKVGKCTLEPSKKRCPVSHPEFEIFRAWSFINNIRFRCSKTEDWQELSKSAKKELFEEKFMRAKDTFPFKEICDWLVRTTFKDVLFSKEAGTINYSNDTSVPCCPVCSRLKKLLGVDWQTIQIKGDSERTVYHKDGTQRVHQKSYSYEDIWHVCFSSDELDDVVQFGTEKLKWEDKKVKELTRLWFNLHDGYARLSLKAIRNINKMLNVGIIYPHAVMMAKVPDIIGEHLFEDNRDGILESLKTLDYQFKKEKDKFSVVNRLISNYKMLDFPEQFAFKNTLYQLEESDWNDVKESCKEFYGEVTWNKFSTEEKTEFIETVAELYQQFFSSEDRDYYKIPRLDKLFVDKLEQMFPDYKGFDRLYHPSMIGFYAPTTEQELENGERMRLLGSPAIESIRNPMVMRVLYTLRNQINELLKRHIIDEETRVVVELARDLNDANMRWAINEYNNRRKKEREGYKERLKEYFEQQKCEKQPTDDEIIRYQLWDEQKAICIYTGKPIGIGQLIDGNEYDLEHTLPRSKSFDDSLKNATLANSYYNRNVKGNSLPCELSNYEDILSRIQPWAEHVEKLKKEINQWKTRSHSATTKSRKDHCIRQRHVLELELDYWEGKVKRFTTKEITQGFRNNQLNDTRIISKYAYHYLRSLFSHVDVQKGEVTSIYRKMLGVQKIDEKKDRSKHSHHAVDAAVLTLIPPAAQREKMLELYYRIEEESFAGHNVDDLQNELLKERKRCGLDIVPDINSFIREHVFVNHINKDQTFTPSRRKTSLVNGEGKYIRDSRGKKVKRVLSSDSFRAALCNDSFYGANMGADGKMFMVIRKPLKSLQEKDLNSKVIVDEKVLKAIKTEVAHYMNMGDKFSTAISKPIWMLGKDGLPRKTDKRGRPINPIRHVRCRVDSAVTFPKAVQLKNQQNVSTKKLVNLTSRSHKEKYYVISGGNYICLVYATLYKNKLERKYKFISNAEAAELRLKDIYEFKKEPFFAEMVEKKKRYSLQAVIKVGTRVLMWKDTPDELYEENVDLSKRLYVIYKFNNAGTDYVFLKHHLEVKEKTNVEAVPFGTTEYQGTLKLGANNFNCLIEGVDFTIDKLGIPHLKSND